MLLYAFTMAVLLALLATLSSYLLLDSASKALKKAIVGPVTLSISSLVVNTMIYSGAVDFSAVSDFMILLGWTGLVVHVTFIAVAALMQIRRSRTA